MITALLALLGFASSIIVMVIVGLLVAEARGQTLHRARGIARRAACSLPPEHQERFAEEWDALIADLGERPLSALAQAVSLRTGARRLARELVATPQPSRATADRRSQPTGGSRTRPLSAGRRTWFVKQLSGLSPLRKLGKLNVTLTIKVPGFILHVVQMASEPSGFTRLEIFRSAGAVGVIVGAAMSALLLFLR